MSHLCLGAQHRDGCIFCIILFYFTFFPLNTLTGVDLSILEGS